MRQALELAIEWIEKQPEETPHSKYDLDTRYVVLRELEAALAQPEQEPVAVKHMMEWVDYLKRKSDYGQHLQISSEMSAGACWDLARELEQFINTTPPQPEKLDQDEVDIRSRLYQRIHELETQLVQPEDKKCENCGEFGECCQDAQPEQEPVGQLLEDAFGRGQVMWFNKPKDESMLYTTPPQRKPLTNEMRKQMKERCDSMEMRGAFADGWTSAEAAHGIKE